MLQPNPKGPRELPPTLEFLEKSAQEAIDARYEKAIRKKRRVLAAGKVALFSTLFVNAHIATYLSDVRENMIETAEARPSIMTLGELPEDSYHKANIYYDGFNTFGAENLVRSIGEGYQAAYGGQNWSTQYNNAPLNSKWLTELVEEKLDDEHITAADFVSYSMGNDPMMDVAAYTVANTDVQVENITIISGPADFDTLTPSTKEELGTAKNLAWIPWIEYSTPFRYILETYFYRDNIERNAWTALDGINTRFFRNDVTTNSFLASQIESVTEMNVMDKIEEIGSYADTKHMPNINVVTINNDRDTVVDNERAAEKICDAAAKEGLYCFIRGVDSFHSGYYTADSVKQYDQTFEHLAPLSNFLTQSEAARLAQRNHYSYGPYAIEAEKEEEED